MSQANRPLLEVKDLRVYYGTGRGPVRAVDGITFTVRRKERFGLVGESGCGKSTTAMAILRLIKPPGRIEGGQITLDGENLLPLSKEEMRQVRWQRIALVPQGAMNSLNPIMRIREQIGDAITTHNEQISRAELETRIRHLLTMVELPHRVANLYPHELSGGMKQRVCIAMASSLNPQLIIADEPTSALDVVVQRAVMQTMIDIQERLESSLIFIGHDMGLTAQVLNRIGVMYAGKLMEVADVRNVYNEPLHPYTQALIGSLPSVKEKRKKVGISGLPPFLLHPPPGCIFHPRCAHAMDICRQRVPEYRELRPGHFVACHLYNEERGVHGNTAA
jgi:peptide/nickel transport system ATP-binding protein